MISEIKASQFGGSTPVSGAKAQSAASQSSKGSQASQASQEAQSEAVPRSDAVSLGGSKGDAGTYNRTARKLSTSDVEALKAAADQRYESLLALVKQLLRKQGEASKRAAGIDNPQSVSEAQAAISEDGEWGVKAVSDRIVQFAIAISGGDKSKYETLKAAIDKGFQQAAKALGGELPGISQETYKETMRKLEAWKNDENA
jgi:hypothetical protein